MEQVYFWFFAIIALLCGSGLLISKHPISGAVSLVGVMLSLAGIYGVLDAAFMGTVQILVYAGAIMMLIIFVIMVLNAAADHSVPRTSPVRMAIGLGASGCFLVIAGAILSGVSYPEPSAGPAINAIGKAMFDLGRMSQGWYLLFEFIGLLLLAAMVAAIQLAKRSLASVNDAPALEEGH